jgi:hypothetical protein
LGIGPIKYTFYYSKDCASESHSETNLQQELSQLRKRGVNLAGREEGEEPRDEDHRDAGEEGEHGGEQEAPVLPACHTAHLSTVSTTTPKLELFQNILRSS